MLGVSAYAQSQNSIAISPLTFEITANPGDVITNAVRVFNPGQEPITVVMHVEDFAPSGETGQAVVEAHQTSTYSIASWTTIENPEVTLGPGEQAVINHTIRVPFNAEPGGHYGALTAEARGGAAAGSGTAISQKVASLLLVAVAGDVKEELVISDFSGPGGIVLDASAVKFASRFENRGSVHLKPRGFVTVTDTFGRELATVALDQKNVLPQSRRLIETTWQPEGLVFGRMRAQLTAIYGSANEPVAASVDFWVIPIKVIGPPLGGLILLLAFVLFFRKRLKLALGVLIRGGK